MLELIIILFSGLMFLVFFLVFRRLKQKRKAIEMGESTVEQTVKNYDLENIQIKSINQKEQQYKNDIEQILKIKVLLNNLEKEFKKINNSKYTVEIVSRINSVLQNLESPLLVTILGEFSSGKSTFINALLEEPILAMKVRPTTATITKIQYSPKRKMEVHYRNGKTKAHDIKDLHTVTVENFVKENNILDDIAYVQIELEKNLLKYLDLADTPGFNSNCERHSEITAEFIKHSDIVFWLFDANQLEKKTTFSLIEKHCRFGKPVGIINKIDQILENETEDEANKYIAELIKLITPFTESVFAISSKYALSEGTHEKSGIEKVNKYFSENIIPDAYNTKKLIIVSKLTGIAIDINNIRESIIKLANDKKVKLDKFSEQVEKYKKDRANYEKSIENWNRDVKRENNEYMVKNTQRYLLCDSINSSISNRSKSLSVRYNELNSEDKRLDKMKEDITRKRTDLETEFSEWLRAFNEYDSKIGKNILDSAWNFFTGEDFTDEKILLNSKSNIYNQHELTFNNQVNSYNDKLQKLYSNWESLSESALDFLNNIVKIKMEQSYYGIKKQYEMISQQENFIRDLQVEYKALSIDLKVFDEKIFQILSSIFEVIKTNELISKLGKISDYTTLINNYKKHNDGYVDLDWKELYSRNKISTIIVGQATETNQKNSATYQRNQNRTTKQV